MFCMSCGKQIDDGSKFCPICGKDPNPLKNPSAGTKKITPKTPAPVHASGQGGGRVNGGVAAVLIVAAVLLSAGIGFGIYALTTHLMESKDESEESMTAVVEESFVDETVVDETAADETTVGETESEGFDEAALNEQEPEAQPVEETVSEDDGSYAEESAMTEDAGSNHPTSLLYAVNAYASSELKPSTKENKTYYACNAIDGDYHTAWVEDAPSVGKGEWITIELDGEHVIDKIEFYGGYQASRYLYTANGKPGYLRVDFSDGTTAYLENQFLMGGDDKTPFTDADAGYSTLVLDPAPKASSITFTIEDAARGVKYDDTCISEIRIYGY